MKKYQVSEPDLRHLIRCELELLNLESNGVDNWQGYPYSPLPTDDEVKKELELFNEIN